MKVIYASRLMKAKDVRKACQEFKEQEKKKKAAVKKHTA